MRLPLLCGRVRDTDAKDWKLIAEAVLAILIARTGLNLMQVSELRNAIRDRLRPIDQTAMSVDAVVLAINRASRLLPGTVCLPRALAAQWMLYRRGLTSTIHIGVSRTSERGFESHAWVTHKQIVLLGGTASPTLYQEMLRLECRPLLG